jgi:hypothetical protein
LIIYLLQWAKTNLPANICTCIFVELIESLKEGKNRIDGSNRIYHLKYQYRTVFCPGVDDMITIFYKKIGVSLITNVMIKFLHNLALFRVKNANFFAEFFGENISKIGPSFCKFRNHGHPVQIGRHVPLRRRPQRLQPRARLPVARGPRDRHEVRQGVPRRPQDGHLRDHQIGENRCRGFGRSFSFGGLLITN